MTHYEVYELVEPTTPGQAVIEALFTTKGGNLFAILPKWPGKEFTVHGVAPEAKAAVTLLGASAPLKWQRAGDGIRITMPDFPAKASDAYVLQIAGVK
jgi:alpha-L-fucosidase